MAEAGWSSFSLALELEVQRVGGVFCRLPGLTLVFLWKGKWVHQSSVGVVGPGCDAIHLESGGCGQDNNVRPFPSWL